MELSKITLGTAQLGLNYGISNISGKPDTNTAIKMLKYAWTHGINAFDTAPAYGNSEKLIGEFIKDELCEEKEEIIIISKAPAIEVKKVISYNEIYEFIKKNLLKSLANLNLNRIPIYLLHRTSDILIKNGIVIDCLSQLKNEGFIEKFGISAYNPEDVRASLNFKDIDVIQVPINIFDHRLIKTGLLKKLKRENYIIFARSIFLQGLFFLKPEKLPDYLKIAREPLQELNELCKEIKIDNMKLAFLFVRDLPEVISLVIGTETLDQIRFNLKLLKEIPLSPKITERIFREFSEIPEKIINPYLWN